MEETIHHEYFKHAQTYLNEYGMKSIVLLQVGAFFEVYGMKDADNNISGSSIADFSVICGLNVSEKTSSCILLFFILYIWLFLLFIIILINV